MEKTYNPSKIEQHWNEFWETHGYHKAKGEGSPYCIMLPPPNVTGTLHMGHGFQQTLMDALIRRARMQGHNTLWQSGTDHAGIATQMVVERELSKAGQTRHDLGREAFINKVWEWRDQSGSTITRQIRRLSASIDWDRTRFSMDSEITRATNEAFVRLFEEGLIYRGKRLVNWDPQLHTALADLEVENHEEAGHLWHFSYPLTDDSGAITIATTRPETMLGDTAVAVHPADERYQALIGKTLTLPLCDREIPIIADESVEREFGTGCVKITPAHDFNDYEMGQRHNLPLINILNGDGTLNENTPEAYRGLDRFEARKKIVEALDATGHLDKIEDYTVNIPRGDRSGAVVEPLLTDQWYLKMEGLAKPAIDAVKTGELEFVPQNWTKTYLQWLENIQDWCISRQLWWGHRIPVWYDDQGKPYVGLDEADARARAKLDSETPLHQEEDVLDTWFTAALYPFSTLGWPDKTPELSTFYPTSVLITGFDIIFFWVARMVMLGKHLMKDIPFRTVYITGLIRDSHGKKMSKTKGNVLDPIDLIDGIDLDTLIEKRCRGLMQPQMAEKIKKITRKEFPEGINPHGTDALRFTFCALASTGRDINFDMGRIEGYRNFCNKIWNAARFVLMNTEAHSLEGEMTFSLADQWIQSALQNTIARVEKAFEQYRFDLLATALYEFIWNEYCDWYLELSKCTLNNPDATEAELRGTRRTLLEVLETTMRLIHPLMPFISEEIWQTVSALLGKQQESILLANYPTSNEQAINTSIEQEFEWLKSIIIALRNVRGEMNVSPAKKVPLLLSKGTAEDKKRVAECLPYLQTLARIETLEWQEDQLPASATTVVGQLELHIPLAGLIDKDAELARLTKEMDKLQKEQEKSSKKLGNASYVDKAPAEVVAKERERLAQTEMALKKLGAHYERIAAL